MTNISDDECVAMQYVFENVDKKPFRDCSDEEQLAIIKGKVDGRCEVFGTSWNPPNWPEIIGLDNIYRVPAPAPTPNEVDWSQIPKRFKYCFTGSDDQLGMFTVDIPIKQTFQGRDYLDVSESSPYTSFSVGKYGFKRGTVESIDSLLVRPLGE